MVGLVSMLTRRCDKKSPIDDLPKSCLMFSISTQTPIVEWYTYMARFLLKIGHQKGVSYDKTGLYAEDTLATLGSIVNTIGRAYAIILREGIFTLTHKNYCILALILK